MGLLNTLNLLIQHPRIINGATIANWNSGVATSGQPGGDLFTYGIVGQWWRLQEAYLRIFPGIWNIASVITVRSYLTIMGGELMIAEEDWDADGTDGTVAFIYWFWLNAEIFGPLRVEVYSDQGADDGVAAPYELRVKSW